MAFPFSDGMRPGTDLLLIASLVGLGIELGLRLPSESKLITWARICRLRNPPIGLLSSLVLRYGQGIINNHSTKVYIMNQYCSYPTNREANCSPGFANEPGYATRSLFLPSSRSRRNRCESYIKELPIVHFFLRIDTISILYLVFSFPLRDIGSLVAWCLSGPRLARIAADCSLRLSSSDRRT